jgi:hypothetical protein
MILTEEQAKSMLGFIGEPCPFCKNKPERVYCRDCDEFFEKEHKPGCQLADSSHDRHRHQRRGDDRMVLLYGIKAP